jgi:hypothetical protein
MRTALFAAVIVLVAAPSPAQDALPPPGPAPRFEVSFGYQGVAADRSQTNRGIWASFGWTSPGPSLGLVVLSDMFGVGSSDLFGTFVDYSVLAGPRLRLRAGSRLQPYVQALAGAVGRIGGSTPDSPYVFRPKTEFQVAASLGLDLQVSRTVTLRMAQIEYRSFMGGYRSDRFTVSSGAVFRFGRREP